MVLYHLTDASSFVKSQTLHEQLLESIEANDPKKAWNTAAKIMDTRTAKKIGTKHQMI